MSIINDALKKTQQSLLRRPKKDQKKAVEEKPKDGDEITNVYEKMYEDREKMRSESSNLTKREKRALKKSSSPRSAKNWFNTLLAFLFLVGSLYACYYFLSGNERVQEAFSFTNNFASKQAKSSRYLISKHIQKKRTYKATDLVLNGITFIDGKRVALINDEIYEVGSIVNGKAITSITKDEVKLRDDQKFYTIKVR